MGDAVIQEKIQKKMKVFLLHAGPYKYTILILLLGVVLMLLPNGKEEEPMQEREPSEAVEENLEERLEKLISQIDGAGRAQVMLTMACGASYDYQTDQEAGEEADRTQLHTTTVLADTGDGKEAPILIRTTYPAYKGAVVVCQGAERTAVRLSIVRTVASLTGLDSNHIVVVKMKGN